MTSQKINTAFFCDDVRRENNGKLFVIGLYGNRIFSTSFPANLKFWAVLNIKFTQSGAHSFKLRLSAGKKTLQEVSIDVDAAWSGADWLPVPFEPAIFEGPCEMSLSYDAHEGKWKKFYTIPIENFPASNP